MKRVAVGDPRDPRLCLVAYDGGPVGAMLCLVADIELLAGTFGSASAQGQAPWRNIQLIEPKLVD